MDKVGFIQCEKYSPLKETLVYKTAGMNIRAGIAVEMVTKWGMVQGYPDGEDSAGRAKIGLMPVSELVQRACDSAQQLFDEFEKRSWVIELPKPELAKDK